MILSLLWIDPQRTERKESAAEPAPQGAEDWARSVVLALRDTVRELGFDLATASDLPTVQRILGHGTVRALLLAVETWDETTRVLLGSLAAEAPTVPVLGVTPAWDSRLADHLLSHGAQDLLVAHELDPPRLQRALRSAVARLGSLTQLVQREATLSRAVAGSGEGLWDWNLANDRLLCTERWSELVGEASDSPRERSAQSWLERIHPDDRAGFEAAVAQHLEGDSARLEHEHRLRFGDLDPLRDPAPETEKPIEHRWFLVRGRATRNEAGKAVRLAGSICNIDDRKMAEAQLVHDAFHDTLTGLPNRALFSDRLRQALRRRHRRPTESFAVLYFDLDRFKQVNDRLGHAVGDQLLVAIARRLRENLRPGDTLARLGGDELGLLVHDVATPEDATQVAKRVQEMLTEKYSIGHHELFTSASIGIALAAGDSDYQRPEEMLRDADLALYRAKAAGRATYEVFDREMHRRAMALLRLETELRRAVHRKQFVMHYQPIVSIESGGLVGFEALVRWVHPSRGLVPPREFLGVAEATGLIVPLGWWVLDQACRQMADWQDRYPTDPPLAMSANVSGKLFLQTDVVERLASLLEEAGLAPESLRLEITERVLLDHGEEALQRLAATRALGVQLHLDDFGTGYSSLSHLQRFRYDSLKIDPSYIHRLDREEGSQALVRTLVTLGQQLEMNVIAEGVETADQFRRLKELHCPEGQGHWFARPMDAASAEALIRQSVGVST